MTIASLIAPYETISVVGMCKNAGKTTVLNELILRYKDKLPLAITSIGMDGESVDLVTSTKKPEIYVRENTLIATAANLVKYCDITKEILSSSGMTTPMGEVVIIRARSDGFVRIGGPSMTAQIIELNKLLFQYGAKKIIVDGAVGRRSLSAPDVSEATILCTGASYSPSIDVVVDDTAHICRLLMLEKSLVFFCTSQAKFTLMLTDGTVIYEDALSLYETLRKHTSVASILVKGAVTDAALKPLLMSGIRLNGIELCAEDASKFLIDLNTAQKIQSRGMKLSVVNRVELIAVAINPFSAYGASFNPAELYDRMSKAVDDVPIFNVLERK